MADRAAAPDGSGPDPGTAPPDGARPERLPKEPRPERLVVNVADLRRRLGQRRDEPVELTLERLNVVGSWTAPEPVVGAVTVESIERGVSVIGQVRFTWEGECRRCLDLTTGSLDVDILEIFQEADSSPDRTGPAPDDDGDDIRPLVGDQVDLVPVVRDAVLLSLPLAPLCRQDCAGPDPDRYPAVTADELIEQRVEEAADIPDPRWAALDELDFDQN